MVVDCGCGISVKPLAGKVPIPWIVTLVPVPELSVVVQASRTDWLPPIVTADGVAVKELIVGAGQAEAVTVVCTVAWPPQPTVAVSVYVVVD